MNRSYDKANNVLRDLHEKLLNLVNKTGLETLSSTPSGAYDFAATVVIANRFGKGLWSDDEGAVARLRDEAALSSVRDNNRIATFDPAKLVLDADTTDILVRAKRLLHWWLRDGNWASPSSNLKVPPGETFITSRGKTSVFQKLKDTQKWTITEDALNDWVQLTLATRWLRRITRDHLEAKYGKRFNVILSECYEEFLSETKWEKGRSFKVPEIPEFEVWKRLISKLVTFVNGSRFSSVPKDTEKRRPINVEPLLNCILQLMLGTEIKDCLKRNADNDLFTGQLDHKLLSRNLKLATIDFSGASQTIHKGLVEQQFPRGVARKLMAYRSPMLRYEYDMDTYRSKPTDETFGVFAKRLIAERHKEREVLKLRSGIVLPAELLADILKADNEVNSWKELQMFAAMGNGTTFEVLTAILLSIARVLDPNARVYGDDVIIDRTKAQRFIEVCTAIGFVVNGSKSFGSGFFRESCGSFWYNQQAITSFEFDQVVSKRRYILAMNKLLILVKTYTISSKTGPYLTTVCDYLREAWESLMRLAPRDLRNCVGPFIDSELRFNAELNAYKLWIVNDHVMVDDYHGAPVSHFLSESVIQTVSCRLKQLGYDGQVHSWNPFKHLIERKEYATKTAYTVKNKCKIAAYLLSGRVSDDLVRVKEKERSFTYGYKIAHTSGVIFDLDDLLWGCFEPI